MSPQILVSTLLSALLVGSSLASAKASESVPDEGLVLAPSTTAETLYRQGVLQYQKGDLEAAIALYTNALSLDPSSAETYSARAGAFGRLEDYEAAINDYSTAIALNETLAAAYGGRGLARSLQGELNAGVQDLWIAAQLFRQQDKIDQYFETLAIIEGIAP